MCLFALSLGLKVPLNGITVLVLTSVSGKVLMKESRTPFFEKGRTGENWRGKSPMSDWDVPKALFEDLLSSLRQEESRAADTALPDEGEELLW